MGGVIKMKRFAQIEYGKAHWVFEAEEKPEFAPNIVLIDITNRPEIQEGWSYDEVTGEFTEPQPSKNHVWDGTQWVVDIEKLKVDKKAEIADARWLEETGGITLNGVEVATDRESQALLTGAVLKAQDDPSHIVNWKARNGWFQLDSATLIAVADAVRAHVQACFDKEKLFTEQIDIATTSAELEAIKWE
jgi:hypothetical protein